MSIPNLIKIGHFFHSWKGCLEALRQCGYFVNISLCLQEGNILE